MHLEPLSPINLNIQKKLIEYPLIIPVIGEHFKMSSKHKIEWYIL